jgi:hypothetical protein
MQDDLGANAPRIFPLLNVHSDGHPGNNSRLSPCRSVELKIEGATSGFSVSGTGVAVGVGVTVAVGSNVAVGENSGVGEGVGVKVGVADGIVGVAEYRGTALPLGVPCGVGRGM